MTITQNTAAEKLTPNLEITLLHIFLIFIKVLLINVVLL